MKLPARAITNAVAKFSQSTPENLDQLEDLKFKAINRLQKIYADFSVKNWGDDEAINACHGAMKEAIGSLGPIEETLYAALKERRDAKYAATFASDVPGLGQYERELVRMRYS